MAGQRWAQLSKFLKTPEGLGASAISLAFCLAIAVPYFWVAALSGNRVFTWVLTAPLDQEVYVSWTRQAADGALFMRSLFSTESDPGVQVNLAFYLCGRACHWLGIAPRYGLQMMRLLAGALFCPLLYSFLMHLGGNARQRLLAYFSVLFGSGLGWVASRYWQSQPDIQAPIDIWQPEAVTFQTFYAISLHALALTVLLAFFVVAFRARSSSRPLIDHLTAGLLLALLANCHSYDFIHIVVVWSGFLALRWWRGERPQVGTVLTFGLGGLSLLYQLYVHQQSPLFQAKAAVKLLSPALPYTLWGLGLALLPAVYWLRRPVPGLSRRSQDLLLCWAILGVASAYLPLAFQRRMIMGAHIPWFTLYGFTVAVWLRRPWHLVAAACILIPSNLVVVSRDVRIALEADPVSPQLAELSLGERLDPNKMHRVHQLAYENEMLFWMEKNLPPGGTVLSLPTFSLYVPGRLGMRVYCGHWGETIHFEQKFQHTLEMLTLPMSDSDRLTRLREMQIDYLVTYSDPQQWQGRPLNDFRNQTPSCLKLLHHNPLMTLYAVVPQSAGTPPAGLERKEPPKTH